MDLSISCSSEMRTLFRSISTDVPGTLKLSPLNKKLKLDDSCTSNSKSEIVDWTGGVFALASNFRFRISNLRCRNRPISNLLPGPRHCDAGELPKGAKCHSSRSEAETEVFFGIALVFVRRLVVVRV